METIEEGKMTMRGYTITHSMKLVTEECYLCGIVFAMPDDFQEVRLRKRDSFYCPNGHSQRYLGETDAQRLKRAQAQAQQLRDQLDASERQKRAYKGQATRLRNKVEKAEKGVCPHCHRNFEDLRRHMESKHGGLT